eukprot:TRINITY_DN12108_c0_g1_i1.p1 TRINITY_DN12108_c0_g1~~TRINITY_DN12108_c0_g1_i1.p1  ORF type:complete len:116 (+),score=33.54 TRINITY_DN12108_c0_g1_i1:167-514(+)
MSTNTSDLQLSITTMPPSRPADYYLCALGGCVFIDFDRQEKDLIVLKRMSFDGYGCCTLPKETIPLNKEDSMFFKECFRTKTLDQNRLAKIIKQTAKDNKEFLWEDALKEYKLLD